MIRFDHVSKSYKGTPRPALDDISTEILRGEFVFVVGASGSGKSTFLRLILREEKATRGKLHVLGQDLGSISNRKVPYFRRNVGVVFQDFRLLTNKTVFDNVAFTLKVIGKSKGFIHEAVPDVLAMVGLEGKAQRFPHELSGGEQQRVAIARAVVNKPQILLADEPTGNLDPATSAGITAVLERINAAGTTILMATHEAGIVDRMQRRVIEIKQGVLVRDERHGGYGFTAAIPVQRGEREAVVASYSPDAADSAVATPAAAATLVTAKPSRAQRKAEKKAVKDASRGSRSARHAEPAVAAVVTSAGESASKERPMPAQNTPAQNTPAQNVPAQAAPPTVPAPERSATTSSVPIVSGAGAGAGAAVAAPESAGAAHRRTSPPEAAEERRAASADESAEREPVAAVVPTASRSAGAAVDAHFAGPPTAPVRRPESDDVAELSLAERLGLRAPERRDHDDDSNQDVGPVS
ncbi:cell division ATP-binding protein FtsE [Humibacter albus]|uniref:cell division ATP-binding protein FtsE n=1 Tax=Humibacter albus TaxID=427754 RepID=UPI00040E7F87|nr:cell division ATP-binding protein FtsE [Humibacter albus]